ncbi:hypothetical protein I8J29_16505 [Paenibacillus sp. MWE-103]|uniref:Uncharacterized protein n=1 Tax=Paenibacillus artemisiicola TaxID=1172618 RepID=A0ABS3WCG0_9BACL|nr:hypothetical protein [Paenibacillus artemisiicola]MBO7745811.1 hypothetical protein [Paenibacillus artemisiicola]
MSYRLFLVYDDTDFEEWVIEELAEYGRVIRSIESLDFFIPQWSSLDSPADVIIIPETVVQSDESFQRIYRSVRHESPGTVFLFIHYRTKDDLILLLEAEGNVCISFDELDADLLEASLRGLTVDHIPRKHLLQVPHISEIPTMFVENDDYIGAEEVEAQPSLQKNDEDAPLPVAETNEPWSIDREDDVVSENSLIANDNRLVEEPIDSLVKPQQAKTKKKNSTAEEQKVKLQKIKERIIIEERIVTIHVPVHFNSILISVLSLYPRAGATFVTSNFARMLGENKVPVAVFEPVLSSIGSTYFELLHGDMNAPKEWKSWAEQVQKNGYISNDKSWLSQGVNWIPANVRPTENWTDEQTMKLLIAAKRFPVALCDISSHYQEPRCKQILSMSDEIWIVTDGDPVQLNHRLQHIDELRIEYPGKPMKVIGNKWTCYIKQSEWREAVMLPTLSLIPDLGSTVIKLAWDGKLAWDDFKLKSTLFSPFKPMARAVMAKEIYALLKQHHGLKAKLKGIFSQLKTPEDEALQTIE